MIIRGSSWCDLVKHADGRVELVHLRGTAVLCTDVATERERWARAAGQALLYLRAAASDDGRVCAIGQGHDDGEAWATIEGGASFSLGLTACPFPVLIFGDSLGWVVYIQRTTGDHERGVPASVDVIRIARHGDHGLIATTTVPATSQGFLYVASNGQPVTQDQGRGAIPGLALASPSEGGVWVGQSTSAATIVLYDSMAPNGRSFPLGTPGGQPPHIVEHGGTYYVCSWVDGGAWLSTHRRPFAPVVPEPIESVEDTSGLPIDVWAYMLPPAGVFPRTSDIPGHGHEMHCVFDGRNFWTLPFGEPDHWVRMVVEGDTLTFREDRSRDGQSTGDYSFTRGLWARRAMRVGDRIVNADNHLVRYQPDGCRVVDVHAFPFRTGLWKRWTTFDCGGDLGWRDVIAYLYDPGGLTDTYELSYFAKGFGFFRWEEYDQQTNAVRHWTTFNRFGGRAPQPTPGCWKREHLALTPSNWQGGGAPAMTITEYQAVATGHRARAVCGPDDGAGWSSWVEWIWRRVGESTWQQQGERRNPRDDDDHTFTFPGNGEYEIGLRWGSGQTGKRRVVRVGATIDPPPPPPPPPPPGDLDRIDGQLQLEAGGGFHVNGRPVLPTLCHYGDALSKWMRDRDHVLRNLDLIAGAGYHGTRYWTVLDGAWWNGRHVGENFQHDYWDQHRAFLLAHKERGLVVQICQGSTTQDALPDPHGFMNRLCEVLADVGPEVAACLEGVNEDRDTGNKGPAWLAELMSIPTARLPQILRGLSSYTGTEDPVILNAYSRDPAHMFMVHPYRGGGNHDKTRHLMSLQYENGANARMAIGRMSAAARIAVMTDIEDSRRLTALETADWLARHMPHRVEEIARLTAIASGATMRATEADGERLRRRNGWNSEGPGGGNRVSAIDNRDAMTGATMCGLAAMSFMMRMAYVYFCGVGVISDDGGSQTFDQMPGFFEVPKVRALVPPDVMRYSGPIFHGGETWRDQRTFAARGDVRADHVVHSDGRQVIGIYGPGDLNVPQEKAFTATVDHLFGSEFRLVAGRLQ